MKSYLTYVNYCLPLTYHQGIMYFSHKINSYHTRNCSSSMMDYKFHEDRNLKKLFPMINAVLAQCNYSVNIRRWKVRKKGKTVKKKEKSIHVLCGPLQSHLPLFVLLLQCAGQFQLIFWNNLRFPQWRSVCSEPYLKLMLGSGLLLVPILNAIKCNVITEKNSYWLMIWNTIQSCLLIKKSISHKWLF